MANLIAGRRMKILNFVMILKVEFGAKGDISSHHSAESRQIVVFVIFATSWEAPTGSLWLEIDRPSVDFETCWIVEGSLEMV